MAWLLRVIHLLGQSSSALPVETTAAQPPNLVVHCSLCERDGESHTNYPYGQRRRGWETLCRKCEELLRGWRTLGLQELIDYFGDNHSKAVHEAVRYVNRSRQSRNARVKRSARGGRNGGKLRLLNPKAIQYKSAHGRDECVRHQS